MSQDPTTEPSDITAAAEASSPAETPAPDIPDTGVPDDGILGAIAEDAEGADAGTQGDESLSGSRGNNHGLPSRNVFIGGKRTSIRLDTYSLESLYEIAERERISIHELCTKIHRRNREDPFTLTAALRIFLLTYFRVAATEEGHKSAGHGPRPAPGTSPFGDDAAAAPAASPRRGRGTGERKTPAGRRNGSRSERTLESLAANTLSS